MRLIFMSLLTMICGLFSCTAQTDKYKSVEVEEFEKAIADTAVVRLDVRTPEEYAEGHIAGALNIDVLDSSFEQKATSVLPKDKTIALYCRSGRRSKKAATILADKGYTIVELNTGYNGWTGAGKAVVTSGEEKPQMVGAYTEGRIPTKDEIELFKDTYKGDIELTPITVSTQVVAGTNYKFVCKDKSGSPYQVIIYQKLPAYGGEAEVTSIEKEK